MKSRYRIPKQITSDRSEAIGAVRTLSIGRALVEEGLLFRVVYSEPTMDANVQIAINTPALAQVHLVPPDFAGTGVRLRLAKATTVDASTGNLSLVNLNANSAKVAESVIVLNPDPALSLGTNILDDRYDDFSPEDGEFILEPAVSYLLQFDKPQATTPQLSIQFSMYEITPD
jgi:hypothetical protein